MSIEEIATLIIVAFSFFIMFPVMAGISDFITSLFHISRVSLILISVFGIISTVIIGTFISWLTGNIIKRKE